MLAFLPSATLWQILVTLGIAVLYGLYYYKYRIYIWTQKEIFKETKNPRGKSLPCFPNGWYRVLNSDELKKGEVKYIDYCGRNLAVYRGKEGKVYALDAYCAHMGANMALGGTVIKDKGLQCPFHGWIYDGATGNCVTDSKTNETRTGEIYAYHNDDTCEKKNGSVLVKKCNTEIKVKSYVVREIKNSIMVWYHSNDALREKPLYEPVSYEHGHEYRGESMNFINTHIQDIPENGADLKHFHYVHKYLFSFTNAIGFKWNLRWCQADDPKLHEIMHLDNPKRQAYRKKLLDEVINEQNKKYVSVLGLENTLVVFGVPFKFFTLTGFQVGPGLVYLYMDCPFFRAMYQQSLTPTEKFMQRLSHKIFTDSWLPYFVSAFLLWGEVQQVLGDLRIWNNKKYNPNLVYDLSTQADKHLYQWRTWYGQFYEGCAEMEKELCKYDW